MHECAHEQESAGAPPVGYSLVRIRGVGLLLTAAGFVFGYGLTLQTLWRVWRHNPNYSHGFLIPIVSAWLVWRQRDALSSTKSGSTWSGLILLVPALFLQVVGLRGDVAFLQGISVILAIAGVTWQIYGWVAFWRLILPLGRLPF